MTDAIHSLAAQLEKVQSACESLAKQQSNVLSGSSEGSRSLQSSIQDLALAEFEAAKAKILAYLGAGQYEEAFTVALGANSLECALFACKSASPEAVFHAEGGAAEAGGVLVSQTVLLCLMQQLGSSIASGSTDFKMECEWLQEIAVAIDPNDAAIQPHIKSVLGQLISSVSTAIDSIKDEKDKRKLKMLLTFVRGVAT